MEYGLIGGKLGHSYSKTIHELLCGYSYELCPLPTEADARAFLQRRQFKAINVTIPYKKLVMEYCSFIDPRARAIGAVNTVVNKNGLLYGYNTDYLGFAHLCEAHGVELAGKTVLILGTGGTHNTTRAVALDKGAAKVLTVSRTPDPEKGELSYAEAVRSGAQVVFNTTPAGMYQKIELKGDQQQYDAVYRVGDAGYEMYTYVDSTAKKYADNVNAVADALAGKATVYMLPVPLSSGISLPDELYGKDIFADQKDAEQKIIGYMNGNVKSVALYDALMAHRTEYVYFRTDHHWTATGAYYAYEQFCKAKGITPTPLSSYTVDEYDGFLGTFYRDSNQNAEMAANPDKVVAYHPLSTEATLDYVDNNGQTLRGKIIYDESDAPASLKYGTFITGDNSYSVINNPDVTDGSSCVVVKESFGNAFVPFLTDHYQTIHVIDYRYWKGSLSQFVTENNVQDVLFVNNLSAIRSTALVGYLHGIV